MWDGATRRQPVELLSIHNTLRNSVCLLSASMERPSTATKTPASHRDVYSSTNSWMTSTRKLRRAAERQIHLISSNIRYYQPLLESAVVTTCNYMTTILIWPVTVHRGNFMSTTLRQIYCVIRQNCRLDAALSLKSGEPGEGTGRPDWSRSGERVAWCCSVWTWWCGTKLFVMRYITRPPTRDARPFARLPSSETVRWSFSDERMTYLALIERLQRVWVCVCVCVIRVCINMASTVLSWCHCRRWKQKAPRLTSPRGWLSGCSIVYSTAWASVLAAVPHCLFALHCYGHTANCMMVSIGRASNPIYIRGGFLTKTTLSRAWSFAWKHWRHWGALMRQYSNCLHFEVHTTTPIFTHPAPVCAPLHLTPSTPLHHQLYAESKRIRGDSTSAYVLLLTYIFIYSWLCTKIVHTRHHLLYRLISFMYRRCMAPCVVHNEVPAWQF